MSVRLIRTPASGRFLLTVANGAILDRKIVAWSVDMEPTGPSMLVHAETDNGCRITLTLGTAKRARRRVARRKAEKR